MSILHFLDLDLLLLVGLDLPELQTVLLLQLVLFLQFQIKWFNLKPLLYLLKFSLQQQNILIKLGLLVQSRSICCAPILTRLRGMNLREWEKFQTLNQELLLLLLLLTLRDLSFTTLVALLEITLL